MFPKVYPISGTHIIYDFWSPRCVYMTRPTAGDVYLVYSEQKKLCRIEFSKNMKRRFSGLKCDILLVHTIHTSDMEPLEKFWHDMFASKHVGQEWFDLLSDDVVLFCLQKEMEVAR